MGYSFAGRRIVVVVHSGQMSSSGQLRVVPPVVIRDTCPKSVIGRRTPPVHRKDPDV